MKVTTSLWRWAGIGAFALGVSPAVFAQGGAFGGGVGPPLQVVKPPREFATSEEHYAYLLEQAKGGTKHTLATVPRWDGLWQPAGNTHLEMFIDGQGFAGKVREGVLTPAYDAAYRERWREQTELGQVNYDRLGHCEPPGYPRILLEPYTHEFINLPDVAYQINDFGPSIRRTYIGKEHSNVYGTHSWYGDTIGFLGRQQARLEHQVRAACRLHALVADDEQRCSKAPRSGSSRPIPAAFSASRCKSRSTTSICCKSPSAPYLPTGSQPTWSRTAIASSIGNAIRPTTRSSTTKA